MSTNALGLRRGISVEVKRAVRRRCGFGCVVCGASIYEYDHFDPPFAEAREHSAEGITLLCPTHHSEKTRGQLPLEILQTFIANPMAQRRGETSINRPYFQHIPALALGGGMVIENTPIPVMVNGSPLIQFLPPEDGSKITRINALITSGDGANLLRIVENEWIVETGVWDYEWVGQRMTVRDNSGTTALQLTVHPPKLIEIDHLRFNRDGFDVNLTRSEMRVNGVTFVDCVMSNCAVGMALGKSTSGSAINIR